MGDLNQILITGANGFVGHAAVTAARSRGIKVLALYRRSPLPDWAADPGITPLQADLSDPASADLIAAHRFDAVIHAAAHLGGDAHAHAKDTLQATRTLLTALSHPPARLVLVSSIAVYDTMKLAPGATLTESCALETPDTARDAYTEAKLRQEDLCRAADLPLWVMRPGAVYGPGRSWHALLGFWASKLHVQITSDGELPLVHVDHLADSLLRAAATAPSPDQAALNVLDDDRPNRSRFLTVHRRLTGWPRLVLPLPFGIWLILVKLLKPFAARLPGLFQEPVLRARLMPLRYPNTALRAALGGSDIAPFDEMLARSMRESVT